MFAPHLTLLGSSNYAVTDNCRTSYYQDRERIVPALLRTPTVLSFLLFC